MHLLRISVTFPRAPNLFRSFYRPRANQNTHVCSNQTLLCHPLQACWGGQAITVTLAPRSCHNLFTPGFKSHQFCRFPPSPVPSTCADQRVLAGASVGAQFSKTIIIIRHDVTLLRPPRQNESFKPIGAAGALSDFSTNRKLIWRLVRSCAY